MKKIISIMLSVVLFGMLAVSSIAALSPGTRPALEGLEVTYTDENGQEVTRTVDENDISDYLILVDARDAEDGTTLQEVKDDLSSDDRIADVIGEEYDNHSLISLFGFKYGEYIASGEITVDLSTIIDVNSPRIKESQAFALVMFDGEKWVVKDILLVKKGSFRFKFDTAKEIDNVFALLALNVPESPQTGEKNYLPLLLTLTALFATVSIYSIRRYIKD